MLSFLYLVPFLHLTNTTAYVHPTRVAPTTHAPYFLHMYRPTGILKVYLKTLLILHHIYI